MVAVQDIIYFRTSYALCSYDLKSETGMTWKIQYQKPLVCVWWTIHLELLKKLTRMETGEVVLKLKATTPESVGVYAWCLLTLPSGLKQGKVSLLLHIYLISTQYNII